ncbi:hypothetical protein ACFLRC_04915, partial [Candidatus Altiarchaeota archaeon]
FESCCGDDTAANEIVTSLDCGTTTDPCTTDPGIEGCADNFWDCVLPDSSAVVYGVDDELDSYIAYPDPLHIIRCYHGVWYDCDHNQASCDLCRQKYQGAWPDSDSTCDGGIDPCWVAEGEEDTFGEYGNALEPKPPFGDDPGFVNGIDLVECCGDDQNEFYIDNLSTGGGIACCDNSDDSVYLNGSCTDDFSECNPSDNCPDGADDVENTCTNCGMGWDLIEGDSPGECWMNMCCGDDINESYEFFFDIADTVGPPYSGCDNITDNRCVGGTNTSDEACCDNSTDCVFEEECYPEDSTANVSLPDVAGAYCIANSMWIDCDQNQNICENECLLNRTQGGEDDPFGEYNAGNSIECCGDDPGEFLSLMEDVKDQLPGADGLCDGGNDTTDEPCVGGSNISDVACCNATKCVFDGTCYSHQEMEDVDGDGVVGEFCFVKVWTDCDTSESYCSTSSEYCNLDWTVGGENETFGEYEDGGPQAECCGDDFGESYEFMADLADHDDDGNCSGGDDITVLYCVNGSDVDDNACCDMGNDCVYNQTCYPYFTLADVDEDGVEGEICTSGSHWTDCDTTLTYCENFCNFTDRWVVGGENVTFGEYENGTGHPSWGKECCGDDSGEFYQDNSSFVGGNISCCDNSSDCAWSNGTGIYCCGPDSWEGNSSECGTCEDGIDNDCDGYADKNDTDCMEGPRCIWRVYNISGQCVYNPTYWAANVSTQSLDPSGANNTNATVPFNLSTGFATPWFCTDSLYNSTYYNVTQDMDEEGKNISNWSVEFGDDEFFKKNLPDIDDNMTGLGHNYDSPDGRYVDGQGRPYYIATVNATDNENESCYANVSVYVENAPPAAYASVWNTSQWIDNVTTKDWFDNTSNGTGFNIGGYDPSFHGRNATEIVGENFYFTDDNVLDYNTNNTTGWSRDQDECTDLGFPVCKNIT